MFSFKNLTKGLFIKVVAIFSLSLFGSGCKPEEGSACSSEKRDPPPPSAKKQEPDPFEKHGPPVPINEKLLGTECILPKNRCGGTWSSYYDGVSMVCYGRESTWLQKCSELARAEDVAESDFTSRKQSIIRPRSPTRLLGLPPNPPSLPRRFFLLDYLYRLATVHQFKSCTQYVQKQSIK